jgi:anti-sigma-K factor RskA
VTDPRVDQRVEELLALAALGELDPQQAAELQGLADAHPEVAAEWRNAAETAASLHLLTAEAPPASLKASVLAAIASTPQEPPARPTDVVDLAQVRQRRQNRRSVMLLGAAAALALVVVGLTVFAGSSGRPNPVAAVVQADDAVERRLSGSLDGSLTVVFSEQVGAVAVTGSDVGELSDGRTYQLWLVDDSGATSVGVFRPNQDGDVAARFDGVDPSGFVLGVTIEPDGGSESPTLPIVASA